MDNETLSHYRIVTKLGAGGMGEVYRAEDTRLGREVAIKILPQAFTEDRERLARFEREARMLAALDHPNIATIFDVDDADETHFLVMQLAEGETLAERIKRGPLPIDESLRIGRQIAEALEYAHARGIIHRDLKPANVMVAPGGQVKVLDFGLAKALESESESLDDSALLSASPTLTRDMTREGVILGTAAYMSPEQAKGETVDEQADIWAFGCVFYEMLTGHRTNPGNSSAEVIAKILEAEPIWDALPTQTPVAVRRLLRRCLAKDPKMRLRSIADARIEIEEAGEPGGEMEALAASVPRRAPWLLAAPWVLALVMALIAGALYLHRGKGEVMPTTRFALPADKLALGQHPVAPIVAISADGSMMAYIEGDGDSGQLFLRHMDSFESIAVEGASEAQSPFFSPDNKWLGFAAEGHIKKVPVTGGRPQDICPIEVLHGAAWASDGTIVFNTASGLMRIGETGGQQTVVTEEDPEREEVGHHTPQVLANGDVLFTTVATGARPLEIALYSPATGERKTLVEGGSNALYLPPGHLLWA
ncbi:MAG: serine/threonine-protein kinase, partial [Acidobacteriota bacterium]